MTKEQKIIVEEAARRCNFIVNYDTAKGGQMENRKTSKIFITEILGKEYHSFQQVRRLDEITTDRLLTKHYESGFVMVSPCRGELTEEENNANFKQFETNLTTGTFSFLPIYGGYIETNTDTGEKNRVFEKGFVIFCFDKNGNVLDFDKLKTLAIGYGVKYKQQDVLIKEPNEPPYYINPKTKQVSVEFSGKIIIDDLAQEFFTRLRKNGKQFTFECVYINPLPQSWMERQRRTLRNEIY